MKNKLVKTFTLGICCIMLSVFISALTPQTDTSAVITTPIHKSIIVPLMDPPF